MKENKINDKIAATKKIGVVVMPIESKKQSQAKNDWMKENSKIYSVRIMKKTETEMFEFVEQQKAKGLDAAAVFKAALREYIANHKEET